MLWLHEGLDWPERGVQKVSDLVGNSAEIQVQGDALAPSCLRVSDRKPHSNWLQQKRAYRCTFLVGAR